MTQRNFPIPPTEFSSAKARVLIIAPYGSYRIAPYVAAAQGMHVEVVIASHGKFALASAHAHGVHMDLAQPDTALNVVLAEHKLRSFGAILGTDDLTIEFAARVARALGLPHNDPRAVRKSRRKDLARAILRDAGIPAPQSRRIDLDQSLREQAMDIRFPCVVKPLALSASRGVIRANDTDEFVAACRRTGKIVLDASAADERRFLLAEDFIPGVEVAVEGLLTGGLLDILAMFDKPDPLDGPYFEETYYVTPSRLPNDLQRKIQRTVQTACNAFGLREGPIHAECRVNEHGVWILEVAARTIGGLCARLLRFGTGYGLEELVLAHALGRTVERRLVGGAAGVLMIPVPRAGILRRVEGVLAAQRVPYVDDVVIQVREGHELVPWPEGSSYLGFIFAHASTAQQVELALRTAHDQLRIVTAPLWHAVVATPSLRETSIA